VVAGLVLAAGAGRRFGDTPKQLAELHGRPLLQHAVDAAVAADVLERVVVVLGARAEEVRGAIDFGRAEPVVCSEWDEGQAASLRCGLRALAGTRAAYDGVPGHPVVLGGELVAAALTLAGDEGARGLLRGARTVECGDVADARDVDTVGDLKEM
jgi:molybdenum cofactor cytidylyltransferase